MTQTKAVTTKRMDQKKNMVIGGTKGRTERIEPSKAGIVLPPPSTESTPETSTFTASAAKPVINTPKAVKIPKKKAKKSKKNG